MPDLTHCRVAAIVTDGFEEAELLQPLRALRTVGASVRIITPSGQRSAQGMIHLAPGVRIEADENLAEADPDDFDALLLPGGTVNADALRQNPSALSFITAMEHAGKPIAFICHAGWLLVSAGLVAGRTLTGYPSIRDDVRNAGGKFVDQAVVVDNNWVSSRSPADLPAFNREIVALIDAFTTRQAA